MSGQVDQDITVLRGHAQAILRAAGEADVILRLTGGIAVRERARDLGGLDLGDRHYHDIDLVGRLREVRRTGAIFEHLGFAGDRAVNAQFGTTRRVYHHPSGFHVDLFLDRMDFCHRIELTDRLELHALTLAPADLLLSKLQIVERNRKDLVDAALLLLNFDVRASDAAGIELDRILVLTSDDWGLWRSASDFLAALAGFVPSAGFSAAARRTIGERLDLLETSVAAAPKSRRWRTRARIGRRMRWYRVVEEVL